MIEAFYCHKKSVLHFWTERIQQQQDSALYADSTRFIEEAIQWLGVYENQCPGIRPIDARLVLKDWFSLWLFEQCCIML